MRLMKRKPDGDTTERRTAGRSEETLVKYLSQSLVLEEVGPPKALSHLLLIVSFLVGGLLVFAGFTEVSETAVARGQLVPAGSVHTIQHLEGGILAEIAVEDGQKVDQGELLVRFDGTAALSELEQMQAREIGLALRAERLRAFVANREPDFAFGAGYPDLVRDQREILQLQIEARVAQRNVALSRIKQRKAELETMAKQRVGLEKQVGIMEEQTDMWRKLLDKGLVSRMVYLETERARAQTSAELTGLLGRTTETRAALGEAESSLLELESKLRNEALSEMGTVTADLTQVREAIGKLEDTVRRLEVKAPTRGVVMGLATRTIGGVIGPGQQLMEIVPLNDEIVAEVRLSPRDIGHLREGQPAQVTVTTYDLARFGAIDGRLKHLSATTFEDEQKEPFYKGIIELSQNYVGTVPGQNLIQPGMVVDANIKTGSKSLLEYLLRPVYRGLDGAFRER